jgi:hypothetical protein
MKSNKAPDRCHTCIYYSKEKDACFHGVARSDMRVDCRYHSTILENGDHTLSALLKESTRAKGANGHL